MIRRAIQVGWRQLVLFGAILIFAGLVTEKLLYWQVTEHTRIAHAAAMVYDSQTNVPAERGAIFDSNLTPLVTNVPAYLVAADPQFIVERTHGAAMARDMALRLAPILGEDPALLLQSLTLPHMRYVVLARQIDENAKAAIMHLDLPGIIITSTWRAAYPQNALAAPLLGFVNAGGEGQYGLEQEYNRALTGRDGSQFQLVDTTNRSLPVGIQSPRPAVPGAGLVLTIDARIQAVVERRLAISLHRYGAVNGTAVVMDPQTGAILAMASLPAYDPNHFDRVADPTLFGNLALQNYQPGSTFKVISTAAGLDYGAFTPYTTVYDPGYYIRYGMTVRNWDLGGGWGVETPEIMLQHSANVGMAKFVDRFNPPLAFYNYVVDRFGFNAPTGVDLPDEYPGAVRTPVNDRSWQMMDLLTNSYGQGINVTPLQLTTAVAALANHGWRMRPYIVKRIVYADGHSWIARPRRVARAVSDTTAAAMTRILQSSAYNGEATCALTKDYPVAAKTGTATIESPAAHGMDLRGGTVASLIGYAPANDPKFIMLVTINHPIPGPGLRHQWGSVTAAPTWHDIAVNLYRLMSIMPQHGSTNPKLDAIQGPHDWACEFVR